MVGFALVRARASREPTMSMRQAAVSAAVASMTSDRARLWRKTGGRIGGLLWTSLRGAAPRPWRRGAARHCAGASGGVQGLTQGRDGLGHRGARGACLAEGVEHHEVVRDAVV